MTLTFLMLGGAVIPTASAPLPPVASSPVPNLIPVPGLAAAEELLDQLEAHGFTNCELVILSDSSFAVRRGSEVDRTNLPSS